MRYSHSWACHPTERVYARAWAQILADTATILDELAGLGIVRAVASVAGRPYRDGCGSGATPNPSRIPRSDQSPND
jgi:hypothetical protein